MDTTRLLGLLRRKLNETELSVSTYTDAELLEYVRDAVEVLALRKISGLSDLTVDPDPLSVSYGISPIPTTEEGHMLSLLAALEILRETYRGKLNRGEIGLNWKSGLEEESTISAEKAWRDVIRDFESQLDLLIIMNKSGSHATRPQ